VLLLAPLVLLPAGLAAALWTFELVLALAVSLWLMIERWQLSRHESLWLVGIVLLSGPAVEALRLGQLAPLMLLAMTAAMSIADRHPRLSGLLLDLLVVKPQQLFPLLLFCLGNGRRQLMITAIALMVILFGLAELMFGTSGMTLYLVTVADPANLQLMQPELTPTVRGQMMLLFGVHSWLTSVVAAVAWVLSATVIALIAWRNRGSRHWITLCLAACLPLGLVTSLHCHDYDLLLLLPGVVSLMRTKLWVSLNTWLKACFMLGTLAFALPFYTDIHYGYLLRGGTLNPYFTLLFAFALCMACAALKTPLDFAPAAAADPSATRLI
jgi:hypothetical protein